MLAFARRTTTLVASLTLFGLGHPVAPAAAADRMEGRTVPNPSIVSDEDLAAAKDRTGLVGEGTAVRPRAPLPRAPSQVSSFDAIFNQPPFPTPADPTGAKGGTWHAMAVNVHVALYDSGGTVHPNFDPPLRLKNSVKPSGFSFPAGTDDFDPKLVYDPYDDTFILVYLALNEGQEKSWIVVATFADDPSASDTGNWCIRRIRSDQLKDGKKSWADYPGVGFTSDRVAISTNQFGFGSFPYHGAQILSLSKASLYDCGESLSFKAFGKKRTRNPDGSKAFTIQPAVTNGGVLPATQYLLSFDFGVTAGKTLVLWRIKRASGKLKLAKTALAAGKAVVAPAGTQCNGTNGNPNTWWDTGDLRLVNAFFDVDLGRIYAAHAVQHDVAPSSYVEAGVRWYEVDPGSPLSSSTLESKGRLGINRVDLGWPVMATDSSGTLFVAVSGASAPLDRCLSSYAAEVDPSTKAFSTALLTTGVGRYEALSGTERWGDYNGISRDPTDGSKMVMVNAYTVDDGLGSPNTTWDWQQVVDIVTSV